MSEIKSDILLGVKLNQRDLDNIQKQLSNLKIDPISLSVDTKGLKLVTDSINIIQKTAIETAKSFKNIGRDKMFSLNVENMPMVIVFYLDINSFAFTVNEIH